MSSSPERTKLAPVLSLVVAIGLLACSDRPTAPPSGDPVSSIEVSGVRINESEFRSTGRFAIGIVAKAQGGATILNTNVGIAFKVDSVLGEARSSSKYSAARELTSVEKSSGDVRAAILIDNSGSMTTSDPRTLRSGAARLFWETMLPANPNNQVALLDFGVSVSAPFTETRLMQNWTSSATSLAASIVGISVGLRGTPLYESISETSGWISSSTTRAQQRVLLVLTDGQPTGSSNRAAAIAAAQAASVTIHAVGLGPASDLSVTPDALAVAAVHDLAEQTGGVYAAATEAIALAPIFKILATVSNTGQLVGRFRITPVPPSGRVVSGTISVNSGGRIEKAAYSFRAP
jgi:Mg-chelatase subunit ChlD